MYTNEVPFKNKTQMSCPTSMTEIKSTRIKLLSFQAQKSPQAEEQQKEQIKIIITMKLRPNIMSMLLGSLHQLWKHR